MYYFLLPSSKIRDATFLFNEEGKSVIAIMSSAGYMYTQLMDESSSAQHGPFYVTNVLEITHEDLKVSKINLPLWFYRAWSSMNLRFCSVLTPSGQQRAGGWRRRLCLLLPCASDAFLQLQPREVLRCDSKPQHHWSAATVSRQCQRVRSPKIVVRNNHRMCNVWWVSTAFHRVTDLPRASLSSAAPMAAVARCRLLCANGLKSWTIQAWCAACSRPLAYHWSSWSSQTPSWSRRSKHCQPKQRSGLLTWIIC